jgi:hypothetical protein
VNCHVTAPWQSVRVYAVRFQLRGKSQNQVYDGIAKRKLVSVYLVMEMNKYLVANLLFQPCHVQVPVKSRTRKLESIWTGTLFTKHMPQLLGEETA